MGHWHVLYKCADVVFLKALGLFSLFLKLSDSGHTAHWEYVKALWSPVPRLAVHENTI